MLHATPYGITARIMWGAAGSYGRANVTPCGNNLGSSHPLCPPCLCGDKGNNLGLISIYIAFHQLSYRIGDGNGGFLIKYLIFML